MVGDGDVVGDDLDVLHMLTLMLHCLDLTLMLVQEGDGPDERQVLLVVTSRSCLVIQEGQGFSEGIGYQQGLQETLGVAVELELVVLLLPGEKAVQRLLLTLGMVDRLRLLTVLVTLRIRQRLRSSSST